MPVTCWLWDVVRAPVRLTDVFSFAMYACIRTQDHQNASTGCCLHLRQGSHASLCMATIRIV